MSDGQLLCALYSLETANTRGYYLAFEKHPAIRKMEKFA